MVEGNASMYLGSPRMAEVVIGEHDLARGDGRRADARDGQRLRRQPLRRRRRRDRPGPPLPLVPADELDAAHRPAATPRAPIDDREADSRHRARRGAPRLRHAHRRRRARRRRLVLRAQAALGARADHRLRPHRRHARRHRRQQPEAPRRRAVRRLGRQGRALHLAVRRVQRAAGLPRRRARLHDRLAGRARRDHPPRRQDDHRGRGGDRARSSR